MSNPTPGTYVAIHKQAFRIAFDFLNEHFPPDHDPNWWEKTMSDVSLIGNMYGENRLAVHLMTGIVEYLSEEDERRKANGGST